MEVAVIGLGNMGSRIAQCILDGGFDLTVWNRTASKMEPLVARGAKAGASAKAAVKGADVIVTSLMDDKSIGDTLQATDGILAGMKQGAVHVCVTTISPDYADELDQMHLEHGSYYVSGPVIGRPHAAASCELTSVLAGDPKAVAIATPACRAYSKEVLAVSESQRIANSMKLCVNYSVISIIETISETYVLAEKCGVPVEHIRDFFQEELFAHPALKEYSEKLRSRDFSGRGGFVMTGGLKDVQLMLASAESVGVSLDIGEVAVRKLLAGVAEGMGEADWSAIYEITRREAGLP
jgi:3-hydroxyisobutyrate dehydrogenase-like beta-hydroxyacid dehydrogenase